MYKRQHEAIAVHKIASYRPEDFLVNMDTSVFDDAVQAAHEATERSEKELANLPKTVSLPPKPDQ